MNILIVQETDGNLTDLYLERVTTDMIYIYALTYAKIIPGTSTGFISDLLENATVDPNKAEKLFDNMSLNKEYFRKEMWLINSDNGTRKLLKEKRFNG